MDSLLTRRLDRLKRAPVSLAPPQLPGSRARPISLTDAHAADLARALGGRTVSSAGASVAVVEKDFDVALDPADLAGLPYPIDTDRPLVCLDVETTGLGTAAGTLAFLVGIGVWQAGRFRVRQFLLPDHAHEAAMLGILAEALPAGAWLVTYNGLTFDWPLLVSRYRLHRREPPAPAGQLDLLPVARQLWRHRLEDARLATVERGICGVHRHADLPGALVPERYFSYLRSRRPEMLHDVVEHNRQDIVSLALLLSTLAGSLAKAAAWPTAHPGDLAGLARAFGRRGRLPEALAAVEAGLAAQAWHAGVVAGASLHRRLAGERARLLGRLGRRAEAAAAWLEIAQRGGPGSAIAWLRVAVYREHVERDIAGAIGACSQAATAAERSALWGHPLAWVERDLAYRLARLRRRQLLSGTVTVTRAA
jgi:uncharacterized protein YprB with RNaseH-like and TPR domain